MGETLARSLIRLLVTVGILAAVYFFIVSPILDTTNETINRAFDVSGGLQDSIDDSLREAGLDSVDLDQGIDQIDNIDLSAAIRNAPDKRTKNLLRCIDRANGDVNRISGCQQRFAGG